MSPSVAGDIRLCIEVLSSPEDGYRWQFTLRTPDARKYLEHVGRRGYTEALEAYEEALLAALSLLKHPCRVSIHTFPAPPGGFRSLLNQLNETPINGLSHHFTRAQGASSGQVGFLVMLLGKQGFLQEEIGRFLLPYAGIRRLTQLEKDEAGDLITWLREHQLSPRELLAQSEPYTDARLSRLPAAS